jgi:HNH endonuclease
VTYEEYAYRAWPILCQLAADGSVITYGDLGELIGTTHRHIGRVLSVIQTYCLNAQLPPLTILVVNKNTGRPGEGFIAWDADDIDTGFEQVYNYTNWLALPNPLAYAGAGFTEEKLAKLLVREPPRSDEVYRLVRDRGISQLIFRRALLDVYEHQCAFCGLSFEVALDAAHIILWSQSSETERLDVRNGLLLCSVHHELFDAGVMRVDRDGVIRVVDSQVSSEMDELMTGDLDGETIFVPAREDHRPWVEALEWRELYADRQ